jgi:cell division protein FtsB
MLKNIKMKKEHPVKRLIDKFSGYLLIFIAILLFTSLVQNVSKIRKAQGRVESALQKVEELESINYELEKNLAKVKSEEYIELQLRDKLGLAKEGEIVVVLPEDEILRRLAPKRVVEEAALPAANWKKWLKLFL